MSYWLRFAFAGYATKYQLSMHQIESPKCVFNPTAHVSPLHRFLITDKGLVSQLRELIYGCDPPNNWGLGCRRPGSPSVMCRHQAFPMRGIQISTTQAITKPWLSTVHSFYWVSLLAEEGNGTHIQVICVCVRHWDRFMGGGRGNKDMLHRLNY